MKEVKKFISIDNKEFDNKNECINYEQKIIDYIANELLFLQECSDCQYHSLCQYLIEKNICRANLCDFVMEKILEVIGK